MLGISKSFEIVEISKQEQPEKVIEIQLVYKYNYYEKEGKRYKLYDKLAQRRWATFKLGLSTMLFNVQVYRRITIWTEGKGQRLKVN